MNTEQVVVERDQSNLSDGKQLDTTGIEPYITKEELKNQDKPFTEKHWNDFAPLIGTTENDYGPHPKLGSGDEDEEYEDQHYEECRGGEYKEVTLRFEKKVRIYCKEKFNMKAKIQKTKSQWDDRYNYGVSFVKKVNPKCGTPRTTYALEGSMMHFSRCLGIPNTRGVSCSMPYKRLPIVVLPKEEIEDVYDATNGHKLLDAVYYPITNDWIVYGDSYESHTKTEGQCKIVKDTIVVKEDCKDTVCSINCTQMEENKSDSNSTTSDENE